MKHVFSFLAACLTCLGGLSGCIDEYSLSPASQQPGRLVVEGYICGNAPVDFRLAFHSPAFMPEIDGLHWEKGVGGMTDFK